MKECFCINNATLESSFVRNFGVRGSGIPPADRGSLAGPAHPGGGVSFAAS